MEHQENIFMNISSAPIPSSGMDSNSLLPETDPFCSEEGDILDQLWLFPTEFPIPSDDFFFSDSVVNPPSSPSLDVSFDANHDQNPPQIPSRQDYPNLNPPVHRRLFESTDQNNAEKPKKMTAQAASVLADMRSQMPRNKVCEDQMSNRCSRTPAMQISTLRGLAGREKRFCHCKASECIKRYCPCFASSNFCGGNCRCQNCQNTTDRFGDLHRSTGKTKAALARCRRRRPVPPPPSSNCQVRDHSTENESLSFAGRPGSSSRSVQPSYTSPCGKRRHTFGDPEDAFKRIKVGGSPKLLDMHQSARRLGSLLPKPGSHGLAPISSSTPKACDYDRFPWDNEEAQNTNNSPSVDVTGKPCSGKETGVSNAREVARTGYTIEDVLDVNTEGTSNTSVYGIESQQQQQQSQQHELLMSNLAARQISRTGEAMAGRNSTYATQPATPNVSKVRNPASDRNQRSEIAPSSQQNETTSSRLEASKAIPRIFRMTMGSGEKAGMFNF